MAAAAMVASPCGGIREQYDADVYLLVSETVGRTAIWFSCSTQKPAPLAGSFLRSPNTLLRHVPRADGLWDNRRILRRRRPVAVSIHAADGVPRRAVQRASRKSVRGMGVAFEFSASWVRISSGSRSLHRGAGERQGHPRSQDLSGKLFMDERAVIQCRRVIILSSE